MMYWYLIVIKLFSTFSRLKIGQSCQPPQATCSLPAAPRQAFVTTNTASPAVDHSMDSAWKTSGTTRLASLPPPAVVCPGAATQSSTQPLLCPGVTTQPLGPVRARSAPGMRNETCSYTSRCPVNGFVQICFCFVGNL